MKLHIFVVRNKTASSAKKFCQ